MSSYPAPTQNIDFFNPAFFTVDETPLTVADANKLYFKKSGGIITGAVSAPSLTLNGTNVENKLTEIDVNTEKLTDIIYNNNTTSILNNLSVNGILTLPNLPNVGTDILSNKQKTTKITYDAGTSVTTVADTLKASSTLIVGSQNYNASDEFSKLQNISRNASTLTINDSIILTGTLDLPSFGNVDTILLDFEEKLTNISYDSGTTTITGDVNVTGNFELGTITDVEQKIIDVSNGITPFISYDATTGKIDVTKDLSLNNVTIGRRAYNSGNGSGIMVRTNLNPSSNDIFSGSIFEVRSVGNNSQLWVGQDLTSSGFNKFRFGYIGPIGYEGNPEYYLGNLDTDGSIVCTRLDVNGDMSCNGNFELGTITNVEQKIIDVSNSITPFISYDATTDKLDVEKDIILSNVIIGKRASNPSNGSGIMVKTLLNPSSNTNSSGSIFEVRSSGDSSRLWAGQDLTSTGFNKFMFGYIGGGEGVPDNYYGKLDTDGSIVCTGLDVNGDTNITGNLQLGSITDVEDAINNAGTPFISYNTTTFNIDVEKNMDLGLNDLCCNFMRPLPSGSYGLSQNWNDSYLSFQNGGHHIDAMNSANGLGRVLYLNFYAERNIILGSHFNNSSTTVNGNLNIIETTGTVPTAFGGSLTLAHNNAGGTSSIVFKSNRDVNSDYAFISYRDNDGVYTQNSLLEIGVQNEGVGSNVDNIALMPSGFVGINTKIPQAMLDVNGDTNITGNLQIGSILDVEDAINNAGIPSITYDEATETTTFDGSFVVMPQLTITPADVLEDATQEIYSKNGTATLKLGDNDGTTTTFSNILKSENGNASFYGSGEIKYMEYNSTDDQISFLKDTVVNGDIICNGKFELGTITDLEQKIIDISNNSSSGGDLLISDTSVLEIRTQLDVSNQGTGPALKVSQFGAGDDQDVALFNAGLEGDALKIDSSGNMFVYKDMNVSGINITGVLEMGSITDVEQKIIDISNGITPFISYVDDKIVVEKDMDLGLNDLCCNFMRPIGVTKYGLSQDFNLSYLEFGKGGHHIDAMNADGTGRPLSINFFSRENIILGSHVNNSTTIVNGKLDLTETTGTLPSASGGSLTLNHDNSGGTSSIVFKRKTDVNSDYAFISYRDNYGSTQNSLLEIGVQNDGVGDNIDNIALMPGGYVGIKTRSPQATLDVNGDTNITGNLQLGSILDVEDAINNAGGVPSITYDEVTETTTFGGSFVVMPQLTITPEVAFNNATQEIYSKHSELNGVAELKLGNDIGGTIKFNNILKSENGKATFYGNNGVTETKFMEYDPIYDKVNITKDMDLGGNVLYIDNLYIQEATGTAPIGQRGSITLIHDDPGGTSSIVFRSSRDAGIDHGYISYTDDYEGSTTLDRSLLEIGCKNDTGSTTIDNIALMPSGNVGINTRTPQATLDVNGDISCNQMTMNNVYIGERFYHIDDGDGISIRTLNNPDLSGSIFDVRAFGLKASLYCGMNITSSGANPFYFGFIDPDSHKGNEGNTEFYRGKLDTDGSVDCTEIKVNSIPINSFTNFKFGTNFTISGNWGRGNRIRQPTPNLPSISHGLQFVLNSAQGTMTCEQLGTYEITSTVIFRNTNTFSSSGRRNPCIGIAINNDTNDDSGTNTAPKWDLTPHDSTPFACNYARFNEGKVCTLTAKRIHHFTNDTDIVSVNTYDQTATGDAFQDVTTTYLLLSASIQFKYIGNFDNITG